jgi:hypothetical protein
MFFSQFRAAVAIPFQAHFRILPAFPDFEPRIPNTASLAKTLPKPPLRPTAVSEAAHPPHNPGSHAL